MNNIQGWDYESKSNSPYLRLASKGEKIKIRLVSPTLVFQESDLNGNIVDRFAWIVINRETGEVKAFKAGTSIYKSMRVYVSDLEYGDPTKYDFTITRTEEKPSYYTVVASPNKSEVTDEEKKAIESSEIDLKKLFKLEPTKQEMDSYNQVVDEPTPPEEPIDVDDIEYGS